MMRRVLKAIGTIIFWAGWPVLWVYLRQGQRTRLLLIVDDHVLVVKGWIGLNKWGLPGGGVHHNEPNDVALLRELREETGIRLKPTDLRLLVQNKVTQYGLSYRYTSYVAKLNQRPKTQITRALEISDLEWIAIDEVTKHSATADTYQTLQTWLKV